MDYLSWNSTLETGISFIDKQHQRIIADINDLYAVSQQTDEREVLAEVINEMVDYMVKHFAFEEELLEAVGYEFIKAHERMHFLFLKHLDDYHNRFKAGENVLPEILHLLKTWWENHITNDDADFVALVNKKFSGGDTLAAEWLSTTLKMHFAGREA
jgi:hemerythrin